MAHLTVFSYVYGASVLAGVLFNSFFSAPQELELERARV